MNKPNITTVIIEMVIFLLLVIPCALTDDIRYTNTWLFIGALMSLRWHSLTNDNSLKYMTSVFLPILYDLTLFNDAPVGTETEKDPVLVESIEQAHAELNNCLTHWKTHKDDMSEVERSLEYNSLLSKIDRYVETVNSTKAKP